MKKSNLRLYPLILLSLCFTGLIVFSALYLLGIEKNKSVKSAHLSKPMELNFFETAFKFNKRKLDFSDKEIIAGIIPHHLLAADLIAEFFYNLRNKNYDTIILIGPNHFNDGSSPIITSGYDWQTPYGTLEYDKNTLKELLKFKGIEAEEEVIKNEHSITSEVSFVKKIFPNAKFIPIILKSSVKEKRANDLANKLFELSMNKKILILASVDFSHYKSSLAAQQNDRDSIKIINNYNFDQIYDLDIDSPSSIYTLLKFSRLGNAEFQLLNNSNSAILADMPDIESTTSYVTGYFSKKKIYNGIYLPLNQNIEESVKMLFFGDLMLDRYVKEKIEKKGIDYILGKLDEDIFFQDYDLISANLEGAITNDGQHYNPNNEFDFAFEPEMVAGLKKYGFNFFNLANNHINDQGEKGIMETKDNLNNLNIDYSGCQDGKLGECSAKIIEVKGKKVGLVGLSMVSSDLDMNEATDIIGELKKQADLVVANIHWGEEYNYEFNGRERDVAHGLVDLGVDIIIGHHPHFVQGIEIYKDRPIFYSLGNFIFDQYFFDDAQRGLAVSLELNGKNIYLDLYPFKSKLSQVELMDESESSIFFQEIVERSKLINEFSEQVKNGVIYISLN